MRSISHATRVLAALILCASAAACSKPSISTASLPDGAVGVPYSRQMQGEKIESWTVPQGMLPPGLELTRGGLLSGTPTAGGTFTFFVTAANAAAASAGATGPSVTITQDFSLTVR